jgi:hypothetical protein
VDRSGDRGGHKPLVRVRSSVNTSWIRDSDSQEVWQVAPSCWKWRTRVHRASVVRSISQRFPCTHECSLLFKKIWDSQSALQIPHTRLRFFIVKGLLMNRIRIVYWPISGILRIYMSWQMEPGFITHEIQQGIQQSTHNCLKKPRAIIHAFCLLFLPQFLDTCHSIGLHL